jgi:chemotaxis protein CheX
MIFNPDEIFELAQTIWETMLGLPIEPGASEAVGNRPRSIVSCVQITGAWNGAILLDCPGEIAQRAAATMFSTEPQNLTPLDLQDAMAEVTNVIGGHWKSLLPGACQLALPSVVEGGDYSTRVPGTRALGRVAFTCLGHNVSISVLEKKQQEIAA